MSWQRRDPKRHQPSKNRRPSPSFDEVLTFPFEQFVLSTHSVGKDPPHRFALKKLLFAM